MKPYVKEFIPRAVVVKEGHALLVQHKKEGHWFLLGGRVEKEESVTDCLLREIKEETGMKVKVVEFLGVIEHKFENSSLIQHEVNLLFKVEIKGLTVTGKNYSKDADLRVQWAKLTELKRINLQPKPLVSILTGQIEKGFWLSTVKRERY